MTTIAYRDGVMAADSRASDEAVGLEVRKVVRLPNGDVAGGAGTLCEVALALHWLADGREADPPPLSESTVLFTDGGELYMADCGWPGVPVKGFAAIGSGAQGAMVAMHMGASAEEAVAFSARVDPGTGGAIDVLPVQLPKRKCRK